MLQPYLQLQGRQILGDLCTHAHYNPVGFGHLLIPFDSFENPTLNNFTTNLVLVKGTELTGDLESFIQLQARSGTDVDSADAPHVVHLFI